MGRYKSSGDILFAHSVSRYIKTRPGNSNIQYLLKILDEIGEKPLNEIDQDVIDALAVKLYPGCTAATKNRAVYTPVAAVLNAMESKDYTPPRLDRPKGWLPKSNFKRPPKDWYRRVLAECTPNLAALLLFMRVHLRRVSEACSIRPEDIDADTWTVTLRDTKEEQDITFKLAGPVIEQLNWYPWRLNTFVFGFASRWSVYKPLRKACEAAGVPYHVPKDTGRHSGATYLLEQGKTLAEVKEAGRWASVKMPDLIYGHLEHRAIDDEVREMNEKWHEEMTRTGDVISPIQWASSGRGKSKKGK